MNTLDIVLLLLFIPGIIRGISKGFLEQAIALVGIVFSIWAASKFLGPVSEVLQKYITIPEAVLKVVAFLVILVVVSLVVLILAKLLTKVIEMALLGWLMVLGVIIILFDTVNTQFGLVKSDILTTSVVYNLLKDFGYFIFPFLKQLVTSTPPVAA